jgi:adenylate cyclase
VRACARRSCSASPSSAGADPDAAFLLLFGAAFIALLVGGSWYLFPEQKLLIDFTFPLLSSLLIYLTLVFTNFVKEQAQRRQIRSAFGQYLSPRWSNSCPVAGQARARRRSARHDDHVQRRRGFTTISEIYKDDPQGLRR